MQKPLTSSEELGPPSPPNPLLIVDPPKLILFRGQDKDKYFKPYLHHLFFRINNIFLFRNKN